MGYFKKTKSEAMAYAEQRAQRLGNVQRVIEVDGGYRVGGENKINQFFPDVLGWNIHPITI